MRIPVEDLHDVPPLPVVPPLPRRRVEGTRERASGTSGVEHGRKVALVSADDAVALGVLRAWVANHEQRATLTSEAERWARVAADHETRMRAHPPSQPEHHAFRERRDRAAERAAGYRALVSLHDEKVAAPDAEGNR